MVSLHFAGFLRYYSFLLQSVNMRLTLIGVFTLPIEYDYK